MVIKPEYRLPLKGMKMKILLIMPNANIHKLHLGKWHISFREAPLTLTTLAALIPSELNPEIKIVDESVEHIPFKEHYDLVGISCLTGTAKRAYQIADSFRARGVFVVLGGIHVSLVPYEALRHADSIVVGFAEQSWPQLLKDFSKGQIKRIYKDPGSKLNGLPNPRRDLQRRLAYLNPHTVFATRGCKRSCDFCTVSALPFGWHTRPIGEVIDEIKKIKSRRIAFNDVSLLEDREYAKELFSALIPLKKVWGGLCTTQIGQDTEMLELMRKSGCIYLLIGFESVSNLALYDIKKGFNNPKNYHQLVKKIHNQGIILQGCFIFGFDQDDKHIFKQTVDVVNDLKIDIPRYAIYTPYPKTKAFQRLKAEGRILHENWEFYDTQHVVFQPAQMTPRELDNGFQWAFQQTFTYNSVYKRIMGSSHKSFLIKFFGNLAYRLYIHRLIKDVRRFPDNFSALEARWTPATFHLEKQGDCLYANHTY